MIDQVEIDEPLPLKFVDEPVTVKSPVPSSQPVSNSAQSQVKSAASGHKIKSLSSVSKKLPEVEVKWFDNYKPAKPHKVPSQYRECVYWCLVWVDFRLMSCLFSDSERKQPKSWIKKLSM